MQPRPEDVHLVSPWAPSGVAWLLNALLELGVPIFRDAARPTWIADGDGFRLSPHEDDLRRHLPTLSRLERFAFRTDVRLRWSHEWPSAANTRAPIILCVRDGADALLSLHRRFHAHRSFSAFLCEPSEVKFAPPAFDPGLAPADDWALFTLLWQRRMEGRVLLVRLEDLKRDPVRSLRPVAERLGLAPTDADLAHAAECSSFERAREAEQRFIAARPAMDQFRANHSGKSGESRAAMTATDWQHFAGLPALAQRTFGYDLPAEAAAAREDTDLASAARPLIDAAAAWSARHPGLGPLAFAARLAAARDDLLTQGVSADAIHRVMASALWACGLAGSDAPAEQRTLWHTLMPLVAGIRPAGVSGAAIGHAAASAVTSREPEASLAR